MTLKSGCERRIVWEDDTYELHMKLFLLEQLQNKRIITL